MTATRHEVVGNNDEEAFGTATVSELKAAMERVRDNISDPVYAVDPNGDKWRIVEVNDGDVGEVWLAIDGWPDKPWSEVRP